MSRQSHYKICGVDEAGRGPLAGPVFAAAVILNPQKPIDGLNDSKKLSAKKRSKLYDLIIEQSLYYAIASASVLEIDQYNILQASLLAMRRAIMALPITPDMAMIDGIHCPIEIPCEARTIVNGDATVAAISAASILAKVSRDRLMMEIGKNYPQYFFEKHMGYGTKIHLQALNQFGPCMHHRKSFSPVKKAALLYLHA